MALQSEVVGMVSRGSNLFDAGFEQKRVDVACRLDERISHLYGLGSMGKNLPQTEHEHALGRHRHDISNTSSFTATTRATTLQTSPSAKRLEQLSNRSNDNSTCDVSHDILRLCGSASTQTGRDMRPHESISWLNTPRTKVDGDTLFSCGSIPLWNTLQQQAQPHGADTHQDVLHRHGVETVHESMEKSTAGGKQTKDLEFHIRKIHEIEQQGLSPGETSTTDTSQAHDSIHFESPSRSIKLHHSILPSQSPHSVSEHTKSALLRVQEEETMAREVDVTEIVHQCHVTHEHNFTHDCNLTCERNLLKELEAEQMKVEAFRLEVHATRQDLGNEDERERTASREQEVTHEVGVLRTQGVQMQATCANCKNYQLKIGDLEAALEEVARERELAVDSAEFANLRLQLAHEKEQRTLQERAYELANADMEKYKMKFEKLNAQHQEQLVSLVEFEKKNAGLELQRASNAEVDKQRQDVCDRQSALLRKLEAELEQTQRDLVIEREFVVRLLLQIQQLQLEVKREKDRSSSQEIQLRDAFEEVKQQKDNSISDFPNPNVEKFQQTDSLLQGLGSSLDQADLKISQQKTRFQQAIREPDGLRTKQDDKHNLISDFQWKIDAHAQNQKKVEVVLEEAAEDIEWKKLQALKNRTCASHLHLNYDTDANQRSSGCPPIVSFGPSTIMGV